MQYEWSRKEVGCGVVLALAYLLGLAGCNDVSSVSTPPPEPAPLTIATTTLNIGIVGQPYTGFVSGTGGTTPYAWSVSALPSGLQLNASTGTITGTPVGTSNGSHTFTLQDSSSPAVQVQKTLPLSVVSAPPVLTILTTTLPSGTINQPYSETLQAAGGTATLTWSLIAGSLPQNFNLNPLTGVISGTPTGTAASTSNFTVQVADTGGQLDTQGLSITINLPPPALTITTASLPDGEVNQPYATTIEGSGGITPYTWSVSPGMPANLSLNSTGGGISGTPIAQGTTSHTFTLQDSSMPQQTVQKSLSLTIDPALTIITSSLPNGRVNIPYPPATLTATGGVPPLTWQPVGMPFGLTFDAPTHTILGTPMTSGTTSIAFTVQDSTVPFNKTATSTLSLTIDPSFTSR